MLLIDPLSSSNAQERFSSTAKRYPFVKMHGLGNDFVILDARTESLALTPAQCMRVADRHFGVGCDQLILLFPPHHHLADAALQIFNPDGSESETCGNASRCVAYLLMQESQQDHIVLETKGRILDATRAGEEGIAIDMGAPHMEWDQIPLAYPVDTVWVDLMTDFPRSAQAVELRKPAQSHKRSDRQEQPLLSSLPAAVCVNIGNPHAVFFVSDLAAVDLPYWGPLLENHPLFPERANIGFAQVLERDRIQLRVWERGAGLTRACGSGACAALIAAVRRGITDHRAQVVQPGGRLIIAWQSDSHVVMTGPVETVFHGVLAPSLLAHLAHSD